MKASKLLSPKDFTEWVADQVQAGAGLVPFIGSGVSATSGISTGRAFDGYLAWTVYRCVAINGRKQRREQRLDLREQGWPVPPLPSELDVAVEWVWDRFTDACKPFKLEPIPVVDDDGVETKIVKSLDADKNCPAPLEAALRRPLVPRILRDETLTEVDDGHLRELLRGFHSRGILAELASDPDRSSISKSYLETAAVRALHDWRTTLRFLARLKVSDNILLLTEEPDQAVIDSFNIHITRGRKPNLAHTMLCHLAGRARIRTILTTNFDSLIEDAFAQLGERFEVIPVSIRGELPDPNTVHSQNCIVKLHGGLVETRADPSLDNPPSEEDKRRFFNYVRGRDPGEKAGSGFLPGLLLVCGYSGSDPRCVQMIKYLLDRDEDARILWICHSGRDVKDFKRIFGGDDYAVARTKEALGRISKSRIVATKSQHLDQLLYELYQRLTLSLPRGGFAYQFSTNGPPGASFDQFADDSPAAEEEEKVGDQISAAVRRQQEPSSGKVVVVDGATELTAPLRHAFQKLTSGEPRLQGMWLELEDYAGTLALAHEIFAIIAIRLGRFQLDHARFVPKPVGSRASITRRQWAAHVETLSRAWGFEPKDWLIVLDGRNGPGGCASWQRRYWKESEYRKLADLLKALRQPFSDGSTKGKGSENRGFNILYAPYTETRASCEEAKERFLDQKIKDARLTISEEDWQPWQAAKKAAGKEAHELFERHRVCGDSEPDTIWTTYAEPSEDKRPSRVGEQFKESIDRVWEEWVRDLKAGPGKKTTSAARPGRFLYAAVHFRQSRHIAALMSEGVCPCPHQFNDAGVDNDQLREIDVVRWEKQLGEAHILFRKPGGHAWMHRDARLGIAALIENMGPILAPGGPGTTLKFAAQARAGTHFLIANWYGRAYRATGHAMPLLESLYHFYECINFTPYASAPSIEDEKSAVRYRRRFARRAFYEILKALRLGRRSIQFWSQPSEGHGWFSLTSPGGAGYRVLEHLKTVFEQLEEQRRKFSPKLEKLPHGEWLDSLSAEFQRLPRMDNADIPFRGFCLAANFSRIGMGGKTQKGETRFWKKAPPMFLRGCAILLRDAFWKALEQSIRSGMPRRDREVLASRLIEVLRAHDPPESEAPSSTADAANALRDGLRDWRDDDLFKRKRTPAEMLNAAQALYEAGYHHVRRAKLLEHRLVTELGRSSKARPEEFLALSLEAARAWVRVCALCGHAQDIALDLHPDLLQEDLGLRIRCSTVYGLALGRLGRFYEAHRRLNEAHALLSKSEGAVEPLEIGIIELRRTEVHLTEAKLLRRLLLLLLDEDKIKDAKAFEGKICELKGKDVAKQWRRRYFPAEVRPKAWREETLARLQRQHFAKLDDATLALESAEHALSGKTHSSLWWGRLHTLRLAIFAEHWTPPDRSAKDPPSALDVVPRTLAFRTRRDNLQFLERVYHNGRAASSGEHYFLLRLAEYAFRASNRLSLSHTTVSQATDFQSELLGDVNKVQAELSRTKGETLVHRYAKAVKEEFEREIKKSKRRRSH